MSASIFDVISPTVFSLTLLGSVIFHVKGVLLVRCIYLLNPWTSARIMYPVWDVLKD